MARDAAGAAVTRRRKWCKCGCGTSLAHKRADAVWAAPACRMRAKRAKVDETANAERTRRNRSGLQISYRKAVEAAVLAVEAVLSLPRPMDWRPIVELHMGNALSPAQRARAKAQS